MSTIFAHRDDCFILANQILTQYTDVLGTGCTPELLYFSENLTYLVKDDKGTKRAVLRLSRPGYHTQEELEAEIRWMEELKRDSRLILRETIADRDGKFIHVVKSEAGAEYYGTVFTYLTGKPLEELAVNEQLIWFERLGQIAAILHDHTRRWSESHNLPRFHWNYDTMLGTQAIWGDWRKVSTLTPKTYTTLEEADCLIRRQLEEYGMTEENYGLIHGDLRGSNLLIYEHTLKIIDFDDCGYGWYIQDLAASLSFMETEPLMSRLMEAWIKGYQKIAPLHQREIDMIPTFIMMRRLQLLAWVTNRQSSDAVRKIKGDFAEGTVELAEKYIKRI